MKFNYSVLVLAASCYLAVSCTKTNNVTTTIHDTTTIIHKDTVFIQNPKNPIVGLWVGSYQFDANPGLGSFYYSFDLFSDSSIIQQGGGPSGVIYMGKGTWSLSKDSILTASISNTDATQSNWTQKLTAKYSSVNGTLSNGVWQYTSGGTQTGTFSLKRTQ